MLMVTSTKGNGLMTKLMALENTCMLMDLHMKVNGLMINSMEKVLRNGLMVLSMKASLLTD